VSIKLIQKKVWSCSDFMKELGVVYIVERANSSHPAVYFIERKSVGHSEHFNEAETLSQSKHIIEADVGRIRETGEVHKGA
jgi:hypothetical protein